MSNTIIPKSTKSTQPVRKADNRDNTENVVNTITSIDNSTLPLDVAMETDVILSTSSSATTEATDTTVSTDQPKPQRIGIKQRKLEYEEYKATFLTPKTLTDRKQTSISKPLLARITWLVRHLGDNETTVSGFIDTVLQKHIDDYESDYEIWRKL